MWPHFITGIMWSTFYVSFCMAINKQWVPNTNWGNPVNWASGKVPCPQQSAILGSQLTTIPLAVSLSAAASVQSLSLQMTGELIFYNNAELSFTQDTKVLMQSCPDEGEIKFVASAPRQWYNPANWRVVGADRIPVVDPANAVLHLDQVPCQHDMAIFPQDSTFNVMSNRPITVAAVMINGQLFTQGSDFKAYYTSKSGQLQFNLDRATLTGDTCTDAAGCLCGTEMVQDKVCSFVSCDEVNCASPLEPDGTCCPICGALLKMTPSVGFKLSEFKEKVLNLTHKLLQSRVSVQVSISRIEDNMVQVVFTDDEQGKRAQLVAQKVNNELSGYSSVSNVKLLQSGRSREQPRTSVSRTLGLALGLGVGLLLVFVIIIVILAWRKKTRFDRRTGVSACCRSGRGKDRRMRSHSLSLIEEDQNGVEMDDMEAKGSKELKPDAHGTEIRQPAAYKPRESENLLYVSTGGEQENFSNPLYESASRENLAGEE